MASKLEPKLEQKSSVFLKLKKNSDWVKTHSEYGAGMVRVWCQYGASMAWLYSMQSKLRIQGPPKLKLKLNLNIHILILNIHILILNIKI